MKWAGLLAALALLLAYPAIRHLREQPLPPAPSLRLSLPAPAGTDMGTFDEPLDAVISPDQREIVFVATDRRRDTISQPTIGEPQLWRRRLDAERAERIPGTEGARMPAWKQTGNVLAFFADGRLKFLELRSATVSDVAEAPSPAGAAWLPDGSLLFVPGPGPVRRMRDGRVSDATQLERDDSAHVFPATAPGANEFTYVAAGADGRRTIRLQTAGGPTDLSPADGHGVLIGGAPGWLLWVRDGTLLADRRDAEGRMERTEKPIALEAGTTRSGRGLFAASANLLLYAAAAERPRRLAWLDMTGAEAGSITDAGDYWQVRLSPDDRTAAVTVRDPLLRSLDIHLVPVTGAEPAWRITTALAADTDPVWIPGGDRVMFRTMRRGRPEAFVTRAARPRPESVSGAGEESPTPLDAPGEIPTDSRDGELLMQVRSKRGFDVVYVEQATGSTMPVAASPFNETDGRWDPDGRRIAYVSDESGRPDIYVVWRGAGVKDPSPQRVSTGGGTHPRWTADGRALLFLRGSTIMRAELPAARGRTAPPRPLFDLPGIRDFDVAHRGDRIAAIVPVHDDRGGEVTVVTNWSSLLPGDAKQSGQRRGQR